MLELYAVDAACTDLKGERNKYSNLPDLTIRQIIRLKILIFLLLSCELEKALIFIMANLYKKLEREQKHAISGLIDLLSRKLIF